MLVRLFGAGVPVTTGFKSSCSVHARLAGKIPQALQGEDDFSTEPEGLDLACTKRTRVTFACELRGLGYGMAVLFGMDYCIKFRPDIIGLYRKNAIFALTKELFESMRNMVVQNSLAFSYPLPVLMRVFYKALIIK